MSLMLKVSLFGKKFANYVGGVVHTLEFMLLAGRLLTALIGEYLEWAQLSHTMKVYLPECNLVTILIFNIS